MVTLISVSYPDGIMIDEDSEVGIDFGKGWYDKYMREMFQYKHKSKIDRLVDKYNSVIGDKDVK